MVNWLIFCSFVFSMALTLLGVLVDMSYHFTYQPQIENWQQDQQHSLRPFLELNKKYQTHAIFRPRSSFSANLSDLLMEVQKGDLQQPLVDSEMKKEILSLGNNWLDQKHKIKKVVTSRHTRLFCCRSSDWPDFYQTVKRGKSRFACSFLHVLSFHY